MKEEERAEEERVEDEEEFSSSERVANVVFGVLSADTSCATAFVTSCAAAFVTSCAAALVAVADELVSFAVGF